MDAVEDVQVDNEQRKQLYKQWMQMAQENVCPRPLTCVIPCLAGLTICVCGHCKLQKIKKKNTKKTG